MAKSKTQKADSRRREQPDDHTADDLAMNTLRCLYCGQPATLKGR